MRVGTGLVALLLAVAPLPVLAQAWQFSDPLDVTTAHGPGIFHHLESSGRRNLAVSGNQVAVAWEDNRDGAPRVYLARKALKDARFADAVRISGDGEAFEPSIVALDGNRFAVAWEEDGKVHARVAGPAGMGNSVQLDTAEAAQPSLASDGNRLLLVYSRREGRYGRVILQSLHADGLNLTTVDTACPVDATPPTDEQLYPTAVLSGKGVIVAWEDRRPGHTIIMAAAGSRDAACNYTPPQRISLRPGTRNLPYGKGHGVARVALAAYGSGRVMAVWADKRDFREGYDIYAAASPVDGDTLFGANSKVQDEFGNFAQQWHPTVAGHASGKLIVAWDDKREGHADIMLSMKEGDAWSEDLALPGASGPGEQNHPSMVLDSAGNLHITWIERMMISGPSRLRYLSGRPGK
jgi:hypothetical protein